LLSYMWMPSGPTGRSRQCSTCEKMVGTYCVREGETRVRERERREEGRERELEKDPRAKDRQTER